MRCISPLSIPRPHGRGNSDRITVPCGKCYACLSNKRQAWSFRLYNELKNAESAYFVTLTYDDSHVPLDDFCQQHVCKRDVQLFLKRLRKSLSDVKIKYFIVSEYGPTTYRPHYHCIIFNLPADKADLSLLKCWGLGFVSTGTVTAASISYCCKYCVTDSYVMNPSLTKNFMLCSKGLGLSYLTSSMRSYLCENEQGYAVVEDGKKVALPRYYKDKVFSDELKAIVHAKAEEFLESRLMESESASLQHQRKLADIKRIYKNLVKNSKL